MSPDAVRTLLSGFLPGSIESHPGKPLYGHLAGVERISLALELRHSILRPEDRATLSLISLTHDIAKSTTEWQSYLRGNGGKVPHSFGSSFFTMDSTGDIFAADLVRNHHGRIRSAKDAVECWFGDAMNFGVVQDRIRKVLPRWTPDMSESAWCDLEGETLLGLCTDEMTWLRLRSLFSLFVTADRMHALGAEEAAFQPLPPFSAPVFKKDTPLDEWRREVHVACIAEAKRITSPGVFTLTLPTGAGKTTIGLEIASILAEKFGYISVIYALPFISIVEQNAEVARGLFGEENVLEDHSIAVARETDEDATPAERMSSLFRYWRLPVITTTMAQFWEALYGSQANATMNFHRLGRAVVILDEPQGIRADSWPGLGETLNLLAREWGTTFLLMTATQPHIMDAVQTGKTCVREIAPTACRKIRTNRHNYRILEGQHSLDEFPQILRENCPLGSKSGLIVANTRSEARKLHAMLRGMQKTGELPEAPIYFLSTWLAPAHRKRVLSEIRRLEETGAPRFLVATQVVEAGVDLDFEWVVRDFGPFDSIVQVAGRCNRHGGPAPGHVLIVRFTNERGRMFASSVYNAIQLDAMEQIASGCPGFSESDVPELIDRYYSIVCSGLKGSSIWEKIKSGEWDNLPPLYEKAPVPLATLFIEFRPEIRQMLDSLENTRWTLETLDKKRALESALRQHAVEIPESFVPGCRAAVSNLVTGENPPFEQRQSDRWLLSCDGMERLYDSVTGFVPPQELSDGTDGAFL